VTGELQILGSWDRDPSPGWRGHCGAARAAGAGGCGRGWLSSRSRLPGGINRLQGKQEGGHLGMAQRIALDLEAIGPV
jgi:hypothetical protein